MSLSIVQPQKPWFFEESVLLVMQATLTGSLKTLGCLYDISPSESSMMVKAALRRGLTVEYYDVIIFCSDSVKVLNYYGDLCLWNDDEGVQLFAAIGEHGELKRIYRDFEGNLTDAPITQAEES